MHASADKSQTQQLSGLGRLFSGFRLGAGNSRKKDNLGDANSLYFHPELKRWVERGKEDDAYKTSELLPPPMTNTGFGGAAPKRRSLVQRYKLQDNLQVTERLDSGTACVGNACGVNAFLPFHPAFGNGVFMPFSGHAVDDMPSSGPPSASSDCSVASSSSSSTRSNSATSLAGIYNAFSSSSSAGSRCAVPGHGTDGDDTAMSQELPGFFLAEAHAELLTSQRFFSRPANHSRFHDAKLPSHVEEVPHPQVNASCAGVPQTVPTLNNFDSAQLAVARDPFTHAEPQLEPAVQDPSWPAASASTAAAVACELPPPQALPAAAAGHEVVDLGGDATLLCRASSLALSFSEFAHNDSLADAELSKDQHTHQQALQLAAQRFGGQDCRGSPQAKTAAGAEPEQPPSLCESSSFSFLPAAALDSWHSSLDLTTAWNEAAAAAVPGGAGAECIDDCVALQQQQQPASPPPQPQTQPTAAGAAAAGEPRLAHAGHELQPQPPQQRRPVSQEHGQATGAKAGRVDLAAVDTAVDVLKRLRGSLLAAGRGSSSTPGFEADVATGGASSSAGSTTTAGAGAGQGAAPAVGAIGASLAQAAQSLAGLGLLVAPVRCSAQPRTEPPPADTATRPAGVSRVKAVSEPAVGCAAGSGGAGAQAERRTAQPGPGRARPHCLALLRSIGSEWAALKGQLAGALGESATLVAAAAAVVVRQRVLERRVGQLAGERCELAAQVEVERAQRAALEEQLRLERAQRAALEARVLAAASAAPEAGRGAAASGGGGCCCQEQPAALRADLDELLLCLGQESSKVAVLAAALRGAGLDPESMIEQVEAAFVGRDVGGESSC